MLPDNDPPGRDHMRAVARALLPVAASVKMVDLKLDKIGADISDWADAGGTRGQLRALIKAAPALTLADLPAPAARARRPAARMPDRVSPYARRALEMAVRAIRTAPNGATAGDLEQGSLRRRAVGGERPAARGRGVGDAAERRRRYADLRPAPAVAAGSSLIASSGDPSRRGCASRARSRSGSDVMADDDVAPPQGSDRGDGATVIDFAGAARATLAARLKKQNNELENLIDKYNSRYAVVNANGAVLVFEQKPDPLRPGCWLLHKYTFADFMKMHQNRKMHLIVRAPTLKDPDRYRTVSGNAAQLWLDHPRRREFLGGVVFDPWSDGAARVLQFVVAGSGLRPGAAAGN